VTEADHVDPQKLAAAVRYYRRLGQITIAEHWENELAKQERETSNDSR
jgi:hypothetical protein